MDKKFIIIIATAIFLGAGFTYLSFTPTKNPIDKKQISAASKPPPPAKNFNGGQVPAPPPPPPRPSSAKDSLNGKTSSEQTKNYRAFKIISKPHSLIELKKGDIKSLAIEIEHGSENININWMKQIKPGQFNKVYDGPSFSVSYENVPEVAYQVQVSDASGKNENIYFKIKNSQASVAPPSEKKEEPPINPTGEPVKLTSAKPADNHPPQEKAKSDSSNIKIELTGPANINQRAGTRLNLGYQIRGIEKYQIFWFHKPPGKKRGTLIKKKNSLTFSLKKLSKYHAGEFYIQIKDSQGNFHKAKSYFVKIKK